MHCKSASSESKYIRPGDPEIWFGRVYSRRSPSGIQGKAPLVMGSTTEADDVLLKKNSEIWRENEAFTGIKDG